MWYRTVSSRFWYVNLLIRSAWNTCKHAAGRNCYRSRSWYVKSHFWKIGGDKPATSANQKKEDKNYLLVNYFVMYDYSNPEIAVLGVAFHSFEWLFVRLAPIIFVGAIIGIILTHKKNNMDWCLKILNQNEWQTQSRQRATRWTGYVCRPQPQCPWPISDLEGQRETHGSEDYHTCAAVRPYKPTFFCVESRLKGRICACCSG